jgi:oligoendopeptidase F
MFWIEFGNFEKNIFMMIQYTLGRTFFVLAIVMPILANAQGKPEDKKVPDYSNTARKEIPQEYTWRIEDVYPNVAAWRADKDKATAMLEQVTPLVKDWTGSAKNMLAMLELYKDINLKFERLYSYASLQSNMDLGNTELQAMKGEMQSLGVKLGSLFAFFNDDVLKLGQEKFASYLKQEPKLQPYSFILGDVLRNKDHVLPTDQQKIVTLSSMFGRVSSEASGMLNDLEMPAPEVTLSDGKKVKLNYAAYAMNRASSKPEDRQLVMKTFFENQKGFENTLATMLDGGMKQHLFGAQVAKFPDCLSARLFTDNIPTDVYTMLIREVHNNLSPMHRYLNLKKKLLKLDKYRYSDIYASAVPSVKKSFTYDEAVKLSTECMAPLGKDYTDALNVAFTNRWVDIYPNKGKETGAFSSGLYDVHPYVKMNFNGRYDNVSTLAHELGHAMHSHFSSKAQHYVNSNYATFIAEIASTFNEQMLVNYMLKNEKDDFFKLYLLDNYLEGARATVYRQTLFAEFELAMHQHVEAGNSLTAEWLDQKYLELTRLYYGHDKGVVEVDDYIQVEWSRIPHFYMNYYVFQYSTGMIASLALNNMVMSTDNMAQRRYLDLLKAGGSDYPMTLLKNAGVDMTTETPYRAAFKRFDDLVGEMEKIVEKLQKEGKL